MANRPVPIDTTPTTTVTRFQPRHRPALYPDPTDDPARNPLLWEPFREAYRFSGGSITECYRLATLGWDTDRYGQPPRIESLRAIAKREDWQGQAMRVILDEPAKFQEMADAELEQLKPLAVRAMRDMLTGEREPNATVAKLISTALYFGVSGTMARKFGRTEYHAHQPPPEPPPPPPSIEEAAAAREADWLAYKQRKEADGA